MPRPDKKRGFRPMSVNEETYHWRVIHLEGHVVLEVQHAVANGQRLLVDLNAKQEMWFDKTLSLTEGYEQVVVRPKFVREAVLYALEHGWTPRVASPHLRVNAHEANLPIAELTKTPFDLVVDEIMSQTPPVGDINLQGFNVDLLQALRQGDVLLNLNVQCTDNPRCMIIAAGELAPACKEHLRAGEFMTKQWINNICYKGFEAHQIIYRSPKIEFRFITVNKTANYYVTGKVIIEH